MRAAEKNSQTNTVFGPVFLFNVERGPIEPLAPLRRFHALPGTYLWRERRKTVDRVLDLPLLEFGIER